MTQFTTSAKVIQYYSPSALVAKFALAVGDRCERLTQSERYQLATCFTTACHAYCELEDGEEPETLMEVYFSTVSTEMTKNVVACLHLLDPEDLNTIAQILPAVTEYAQNEYVDEMEEDEDSHEIYEGEIVLAPLANVLREVEG